MAAPNSSFKWNQKTALMSPECPPCACGQPAKCICGCKISSGTLVKLCEDCTPDHYQVMGFHLSLPTSAYHYIHSERDLEAFCSRNKKYQDIKTSLDASLSKVFQCRRELTDTVDQAIAGLETLKKRVTQELDMIQCDIEDAGKRMEENLYGRKPYFATPEAVFRYDIKRDSLATAIQDFCHISNFQITPEVSPLDFPNSENSPIEVYSSSLDLDLHTDEELPPLPKTLELQFVVEKKETEGKKKSVLPSAKVSNRKRKRVRKPAKKEEAEDSDTLVINF